MFFYRWLAKLENKFSRFSIQHLMTYIVAGMAMVFVADLILSTMGRSLSSYFTFFLPYFLQGQVWRILTFIFIPPNSSILFIVFALYFYYMIGTTLEAQWGSFWFDIYYFFGMLGTIIAGFITGWATNSYLNLSLFFAFAVMFPNFEIRLFFFLPLKIKYLAFFDAVLFIISFITGSWATRAAILASLVNFFIFFGPSFFRSIRDAIETHKRRKQFQDGFKK
ncbi:MAG: hypothetical protein II727_03825 [Oscillospiraceae bacterium]|nr:hypothetical protein [Oscillospiraceae bacterium]